jgi:hypothetical protein
VDFNVSEEHALKTAYRSTLYHNPRTHSHNTLTAKNFKVYLCGDVLKGLSHALEVFTSYSDVILFIVSKE